MRYPKSIRIILPVLLLLVHCKKPYEPAVIKAANNYLVVDGFINTSAGGTTTIRLSRTRNLTDRVVTIPEQRATAAIEDAQGTAYPLQETGTGGVYNSRTLNLNPAGRYRLSITTFNRNQYRSDLVTSKQTPAIDSVTWQQPGDINLFVNTHDATSTARFYRWEYVETYEYHSLYDTPYGLANGLIYVRDTANFVHICWASANSTGVILGTSAALGQDVINAAPLTVIPQNDGRLLYRYSMLVKQYALTPEAYFYWQIIQKNSQQLGTLFDLQPSQLVGNIHSVTNESEPVVGFVSATNEQQKRIFIDHLDLFNWVVPMPPDYCPVLEIAKDPLNVLNITTSDTTFAPWYFVSNAGLKISKKECLDCTLKGGTNHKPSFWK